MIVCLTYPFIHHMFLFNVAVIFLHTHTSALSLLIPNIAITSDNTFSRNNSFCPQNYFSFDRFDDYVFVFNIGFTFILCITIPCSYLLTNSIHLCRQSLFMFRSRLTYFLMRSIYIVYCFYVCGPLLVLLLLMVVVALDLLVVLLAANYPLSLLFPLHNGSFVCYISHATDFIAHIVFGTDCF